VGKSKISEELAIEIGEKLEKCTYRKDVYAEYPFYYGSIITALRRYGLWKDKKVKKSATTTAAVKAHQAELESGEISCYGLSAKLGVSTPHVYKIGKSLGISFYYTREKRGRAPSVTNEECQAVLDHLVENGGTIVTSAKALDMDSAREKQAIRTYAKSIGFDPRVYRVAYQCHGLWKILPGVPEHAYTNDYFVSAVCTGCNTVHRVTLSNLRGGVSAGCGKCRQFTMRHSILCKETQEVHDSIMRMCKSLNINHRYGAVRLTLQNKGIFTHEGLTYVFYE